MTNPPLAVLRSEITKLLTLRSIRVTVAVTVVLAAGLAYLTGRTGRALLDDGLELGGEYLRSGLLVVVYTQIPMLVLGALSASSEYPAQVRASLAAVPGRGLFLAGKAAALALVGAAVAVVTVAVSCLVAEWALGGYGTMAWLQAGPVAGAVAYLTAMCLLSFTLGMLARNVVVPLVVLVAMTQAGSTLLLQSSLSEAARYLPDLAGTAMFLELSFETLAPATGAVVLAAWVAAGLAVAWWVVRRRDA